MDPNLVLTVDVVALSLAAPALPDQAIRIARLFDGHRSLRAVLEESDLTPRMTVAVVSRLRQLGFLLPSAAEARQTLSPWVDGSPDPLSRALALAAHLDAARDTVPDRGPSAGWTDAIAQAKADGEPEVVHVEPPLQRLAGPPVPEVVPRAEQTVIVAPELLACELGQAGPPGPAPEAEAPPPMAFEDLDEHFFGSYQPEAPPEDFNELEDRPYSRRLAARRRKKSDGWVKHILLRLNLLAP
jgi:hypothetical protein